MFNKFFLSDKERLNDIMSQNVSELQGKIREYQEYPKRMQEKDAQIKELNIKVQELGDQIKDTEYQHKLELSDILMRLTNTHYFYII